MRIKKITQNTRDFKVTDPVVEGGTDLNKETFNGMQDNIETAINDVEEVINDRNYLIATITTKPELSSNYVLTLDKIAEQVGNKLSLVNGKIVIGAGVKRVRVSGAIFVNAPTKAGYVWGQIRKNSGGAIATNITYACAGTSFMSSSISTNITTVQEGDTFDLMADSTCGGTARENRHNTWLCVEVID